MKCSADVQRETVQLGICDYRRSKFELCRLIHQIQEAPSLSLTTWPSPPAGARWHPCSSAGLSTRNKRSLPLIQPTYSNPPK
jgi:hypothetical protein